jgi:arylsulfatase A-like enzyme
VHFFDPHTPYTPHPEFEFGDSPMDDYDEEIRYTDEQLGKLLDEARKPSKSRSVFIAISADHGENFAEHGRDPHARTLYAEVTHVPLVIYGPEVAAGVAAEPVATSDLFPTFIELAGLEVPEASTMVSLAPMLLGEAGDPERMVFQENSWSRPTHHVKGVVQGWYHMIMDLTAGTVELYDLENDPGEKENLYGMDVPEEVELHRALLWFIQTTEIPPEIR